MKPSHALLGVACSVTLVVACSSSSSSSSTSDGGGGGDDGASASSSGASSSSSSGGVGMGDGGLPMATITCYSAADCNEGGTGKVCCYSTMTMATSCVPGQCGTNDYTQCASSDTECPAGYRCVPSPLGGMVHYCMGGGGDAGGTGDARAGDGAAGDGATE